MPKKGAFNFKRHDRVAADHLEPCRHITAFVCVIGHPYLVAKERDKNIAKKG